ncbi:GtrA family protein [Arcobacter sp. LA11]|uniref:GtrA family protein n=1 Tax=Arcobacter sp. LA11 TaxID=1898176 RepID=UPI002159FAB1|nr:GtrA family protein [Arcobacter sp. LA11]
MNKEFIRFILIGIINTIAGYSFYAGFIFIGFSYWLAALFGTILGIIFNFKTIGKFVFKNEDNKLFFRFVSVYILIYFLSILIIAIGKDYGFNDYIAGLFSIVPCAIVSFLLNKFYVYKKENDEDY